MPLTEILNQFAIIDLKLLDSFLATIIQTARSSKSIPEISRQAAAGAIIYSTKVDGSVISYYPLSREVRLSLASSEFNFTESLQQLQSGSFEINKLIPSAAALCGLEMKRVSEFLGTVDVLCPSRSVMYRTETQLAQTIIAVGDAEMNKQIALANQRPEGIVIAIDEQHSRSQRAGKRAPYCSAVFIDDSNGKVVTLAHASNEEAKRLNVKCLAKASRVTGLKTIAAKLNKIDMIVVDGCAASENDLNDHVRSVRRHHDCRLNKDLWHKAKSLGKAWFRLTTKKVSRGKLMYPNLARIPVKTVKRHWTYCAQNCEENVDRFQALWLERIDHWNIDLELPEDGEEYLALTQFIEQYIKHINQYISAKYTSNTESFHHVANKYCSKGLWRSFNVYKARKTLAALDWNENYKKEPRTYTFRRQILSKFIILKGEV